ncbi:MAG: cytosine permease [Atribacter sp.]|jgi:cytosine permease
MSTKKSEDVFEKYALEAVPKESRQSWPSIALIWIGTMICVPALMMGGALITGLDLFHALLAGIIGYTIVVIYMSFQGMQAADLGRPTVSAAVPSFGFSGSRILISLILGISTLGWFGVQANVCGAAFSSVLNTWLGVNFPVWISSLIWGLIMLSTAIIGFNAVKYLNYIAVPALIILSIYGTYSSFVKYGSSILSSYQPPAPFPFVQGIALAVGTFAVGGVIAGDFSRYARNRREAVLSSVWGVWPAGVAMLFMGSVMALLAGTYDITQVMSALGAPVLGLIILILATWTTNTINAYSAGIALTNLFQLPDSKRALATAVAGILGTVLAVAGIMNYFLNFLTILTSTIPPVAGVMIADYWVKKKGDPSKWFRYPGANWVGILSWLIGALVGIYLKIGIAPINAIIVSFVVYLVLISVVKQPQPVPSKKKA